MAEVNVKIVPDTSDLDQAIDKAKQFCGIMNKAVELANSIAQMDLRIPLRAEINGKATELANITAEKEENAEKIDILMNLCKDAMAFLQNNFHPHTTVVMEVDSIRVEETLASRIIGYERN